MTTQEAIQENEKKLLEENIRHHLLDLSLTNAERLKAGLTILMNSGIEAFQSICSNTVQNELAEFVDLLLHPESLAPETCKTPLGLGECIELIKFYTLDNLKLLEKRTFILPKAWMASNVIKGQGHLKAVVHSSALFNVMTAAHFMEAIEKKLIEQGITPESVSQYIHAASQSMIRLHQATIEGNITIVRQQLTVPGVDVNYPNEDGQCFLHLATRENHTEIVKLLLSIPGIKVNKVSNNGWSALHIAARLGYLDIIKALLAMPELDVNQVNSDGWTALHWAAWHGHAHVVSALLTSSTIAVNKVDQSGTTALHWAARNGHADVVISLLAFPEIEVNRLDIEGKAPLHYAAMYDHFQAILALLATPKININQQDIEGMTALHWAARNGNSAIVNVLCSSPNIDMNIVDINVMTPLDYAIRGGFTKIVDMWGNLPPSSNSKLSLFKKIFTIGKKQEN